MSNYKEQDFEEHIVENLEKAGYKSLSHDIYDKDLCLIGSELIAFVLATQPKEYEKIQAQYGAETEAKFLRRVSDEIRSRGVLEVLRKGVSDRGAHFKFAYFKPVSGMNPEHHELYRKNVFCVVRQIRYSKKNENALDLVIFLNGIPLITCELKNSLTGQFVTEAIKQYKQDRDPKEPLFQFKRCLVHFAIGNEKAYMTSRLDGESTFFLPFNKDIENPVNPKGHKTAYIWEDIFTPETLLDLIANYLHLQKLTSKGYDSAKREIVEKTSEALIFPRYHQLDCVRKLIDAAKQDGIGHRYLIQHSAGSGKSNSIAWLAHKLAGLYRKAEDTERLFDSVIVVTDRKVLDQQLQKNIKQFEQVNGVVHAIDENSAQLKTALENGKNIIISTIQKFPVIAETMTTLKGRSFAVIVDEAHTSQSGEDAKHLKQVLSCNLEEAEAKDQSGADADFNLDDEVSKEMQTRGRQKHISYFAFTATPKNKTLELFGVKDSSGEYRAFHTYTMLQAIEEGFIIDVLENYTTFQRYFKLVKKVEDEKEYDKKKALRLLMNYVDLQPHAIEMKTRIILDHFTEKTIKAIQNRGRAMLVTRSRLHAVKFYQMFLKIMQEMSLPYKPLVAFSGTVKDPDTGVEYTEGNMNRLAPRVTIQDAFKMPEYRLLIVANKFQTGFDEPMLHTMYVDKKLGGVNAVQTLSRLNRTAKGKSETVIIDFANDFTDIMNSFQPYYQVTHLEGETDPNKLYTFKNELEKFDIYDKDDINEFCHIYYNSAIEDEAYQPVLDAVAANWKALNTEDERDDFRSLLQSYIRLYGFCSQLISFVDLDLEKLFVFGKNLIKKLKKTEGKLPVEVINAVSLDSLRIQKAFEGDISLDKKTKSSVKSMTSGNPKATVAEFDFLSNIIKTLNDTYGLNLSEEDKLDIEGIRQKVHASEDLRAVMDGDKNSIENIRYKFNKIVDSVLLEFVHTKLDLYKKLSDTKVNPMFKSKLFVDYQQQYNPPPPQS